jgi:hypothetical protein
MICANPINNYPCQVALPNTLLALYPLKCERAPFIALTAVAPGLTPMYRSVLLGQPLELTEGVRGVGWLVSVCVKVFVYVGMCVCKYLSVRMECFCVCVCALACACA